MMKLQCHIIGKVVGVSLLLFQLMGLTEAPGSMAQVRQAAAGGTFNTQTELLHCVAFGPYVGHLNPDTGPHPEPELIDTLLDIIVNQTDFRCIMTYGMLNGLDYTFEAASARGIKVIAIIWLDHPLKPNQNERSIAEGIRLAHKYSDTIIRLSCGSEYRNRHGNPNDPTNYDPVFTQTVRNCINQLREAGVPQPITSIDTWWKWCNEAWRPCKRWDLANDVDWIGVNVYPWWENRFSALFPCTPVANAAQFHLDRLRDVAETYPDKEIVLTEFGWPAGPEEYKELPNEHTKQRCNGAIAGKEHQRRVLEETLTKLDQAGVSRVVFEAFHEGNWKAVKERRPVGSFWGIIEVSPTVSGRIRLEARTDQNGTNIFLNERACLSSFSTEPQAVTDSQGNFEINTPSAFAYSCLQAVQQGYLVGQKSFPQGNLGTLTLLAGDVIQDNMVDIFDLAFVAELYGSDDPRADINADRVVDILDLVLVAKNYRSKGPVTDWQ